MELVLGVIIWSSDLCLVWLVTIFMCLYSLQTCWIFFTHKNPDFTAGVEFKTVTLNKLERKSTVYRISDTITRLIPKVAIHKVTLSENSFFQKTASESYLIWKKIITYLQLHCNVRRNAKLRQQHTSEMLGFCLNIWKLNYMSCWSFVFINYFTNSKSIACFRIHREHSRISTGQFHWNSCGLNYKRSLRWKIHSGFSYHSEHRLHSSNEIGFKIIS